MKIRDISASSIQYIIIQNANLAPKSGLEYIIDPTNQILHELIEYPRDFIQFHDQINYVHNSKIIKKSNPAINCLILPNSNISSITGYSELLGLKHRTCVYFIDGNCTNKKEIIDLIRENNHASWFFKIYNSDQLDEYKKENNFFFKKF